MGRLRYEQKSGEEKLGEWREAVKAWKASGKSIVEYCQIHEMSEGQFKYWRKKLAKTEEETGSDFVALSIVEEAEDVAGGRESDPGRGSRGPGSSGVRIAMGSWKIELEERFDPYALEQVVRVLGRVR